MTDKRVEAIAKAFHDYHERIYKPEYRISWEEAKDKDISKRDWYILFAEIAISSDPVTEDVKRLVELVRIALGVFEHDGRWDSPVARIRWKQSAQNELKKWSGEC